MKTVFHLVVPLIVGLAACSERPKSSGASVETGSLKPSVAESREAWTFARAITSGGHVATLLVTRLDGDTIQAVELSNGRLVGSRDVFDTLADLGEKGLEKAATGPRRTWALKDLLTVAGEGERHLAAGTNFKEHAREAEIEEVFNFPKFGRPTAARSSVAFRPRGLLDYEVEICVRFDRDVRSVEDFDKARKGFFLCGDFTDRAVLMRSINPADVASGQGFSDAKSAPDFFPTGPFLVVPRDWRRFVGSERMTTEVNNDARQDARGREMILDFRQLIEKALTNGGGGHYVYGGVQVPLLHRGVLERGSVVMSGTSEGVIFKPPRLRDYVTGGAKYIFTGPMISGGSAFDTMVDAFLAKERSSGRYLRPGDVVVHRSSTMGEIRVEVVPPKVSGRRIALRLPQPHLR